MNPGQSDERKEPQGYPSGPGGRRSPEMRPAHRQENKGNRERDINELFPSPPWHKGAAAEWLGRQSAGNNSIDNLIPLGLTQLLLLQMNS